MKQQKRTLRLVQVGLLTALAILLNLWPKLPILPAVSWMKLEFSDVPVMIGGFAFGPVYGAAIAAVSALLEFFLTGETGWVGLVMNLISGALPALLAAAVYHRNRTRKGAAVSLVLFVISQVVLMIPLNYFLGSLFFTGSSTSYADARTMVWGLMGWIVLFNTIKSVANAVVIGLLYKSLSRTVLSKELLGGEQENDRSPVAFRRKRTAAVVCLVLGIALLLFTALLTVCLLVPTLFPAFSGTFQKLAANFQGGNALRATVSILLYALFALLFLFLAVFGAVRLVRLKKQD